MGMEKSDEFQKLLSDTLVARTKQEIVEMAVKSECFHAKNEEHFSKWLAMNDSGFGKRCFEYAIAFAKVMQLKAESYTLKDLIDCDKVLDYYHPSGWMWQYAMNILKQCWLHYNEDVFDKFVKDKTEGEI